MSAEIFRHRIAELAKMLDKDELPVNDAQVCSVCINESCWVHISYSDTQVQVHWSALLCCTTGYNASVLYRRLLEANTDSALTAGGFFAIDPCTDVVLYRYHQPLQGLDSQRFYAIFESFSNTALHWRDRLASILERLPAADAPSVVPEQQAPMLSNLV